MTTDPRPPAAPDRPGPGAALDVVLALAGVEAPDAPSLLDDLATRLVDLGAVGPDFPAALRGREELYPTGLPTPVPTAIPHADPGHVRTPGLVVVTLARPVAFGEMGGEGSTVDVRLVAMPLLQDAATHLRALQGLMAVLRDDAAVTGLLEAPDDATLADRARGLLAGGGA